MRALVCHKFAPFAEHKVEDTPAPSLQPGHVRVDVHAAGVNFPDILMVQGQYQMKPPFPFIAGTEAAGVITELGDGVSNLALGDRVICTAMVGGFAEEMVVPVQSVTPLAPSMSFEQGAALTIVYATTIHALKQRANLKTGETMLVLGAAGGVGLAAIEIGKAMGATIIAAASSDEKCAVAKEKGADHVINYASSDLRDALKAVAPKGVDVVYDPVGDKFAEPAMRSLGWAGRYLVIGFAGGEIPKIPLNLTLLKSADIRGVFWGVWSMRNPAENLVNMQELMTYFEAGKIAPRISNSYSLENFKDAFTELAERRAIGKVVLTMK